MNNANWTLRSVDEMDLMYYLDLMLYDKTHEKSEWDKPTAFIDQV